MMGLFMTGVTSLVESSAVGALLAGLVALYEGRLTWKVIEDCTRNTLAISCMFLWIILAALCFSSVYDGLGAVRAIENLLLERWDLGPWAILIVMLAVVHRHGHVPRRHRHAGHRGAALYPARRISSASI